VLVPLTSDIVAKKSNEIIILCLQFGFIHPPF